MILLYILLLIIPVIVYPENILGPFKNEYLIKNYILIILSIYLSWEFLKKIYYSKEIYIKNTDKLCVLYLLFSVISWLISGKYFSNQTILMTFIYTQIFIYISHKKEYMNEKNIILIWEISLSITGIYGLYQWFSGEEVAAMLGNRNFYGGFIICGLPYIVYSMIKKIKAGNFVNKSSLFEFILICLSIFNLIQAKSRAANLILLIITIIFLISMRKRVINILILSVMIWAIAVLFYKPYIISNIKYELLQDVRPYIWNGTVNLISNNAVLGVGTGNFFIEYPKYRPHEYFLSANATDITRDAHNEWLQVWAETGSFGFMSLIAIFFFLGYRVVRIIKSKHMDKFLVVVILSTITIFVHNMVDVNMRYTTMAVIFWVQLGLIASAVEQDNRFGLSFRKNWSKYPVYVLFLGFSVYLIWNFIIRSVCAEIYFQKGINSKNISNWAESVNNYEKALYYEPLNLSLMYYTGFAYDSIGRVDLAIKTYRKITYLAPYYAYVRKNLGTCYLKLNDYSNAIAEYSIHMALNPYDPDCYLNMSYCYYKLGDKTKADQMREKAVELYHMLAANLISAGNYFKAKSYLEMAYKVQPDNAKTVLTLGECYLKLGNNDSTYRIYTDYLRVNPLDKRIQEKLQILKDKK